MTHIIANAPDRMSDRCPAFELYQDKKDAQSNGHIKASELMCMTCRFHGMVRKSKGTVRVECMFPDYLPQLQKDLMEQARIKPYFQELRLMMEGEGSPDAVRSVEELIFGGAEGGEEERMD